MNINDLNKSQLILLALLISFVTSIATGIATVALMEQAPGEIIQPINRTIRETVEKVVRVEAPKQDVLTEEEIKLLIEKIIADREAAILPPLEGSENPEGAPSEASPGSEATAIEALE